ncbi:acetylxylan esterase [Fodinicola acaciae]|uniref:acetylxylan esterase n=1 Tax=Fodinicola acaciae TaxID=2681555 RepID=UPI0013D70147|nr:acetylxylan esterase [Fodinicola acaciae]
MADFDAYWEKIDTELALLPARPEIRRIPGRTTDDFTGYEVRFTSLGSYRIFGYLSVPTGDGPFPALLATPRYGSVNNPPHWVDRLRYVTLTIMHRGQRLADSPYAAAYPGLLTDGIEDPDSYIYRGVAADCLRAAELLLDRPEVDSSRIGVVGDDFAVITAARRPVFAAVQVPDVLLYQWDKRRQNTVAYPVEEFNDYLRTHPDRAAAVARTLGFFDVERHAAAVRAAVRAEVADEAGTMAGLAKVLKAETYAPTHEGQTDNDAVDAWLAGKLGVRPLSKFDKVYA